MTAARHGPSPAGGPAVPPMLAAEARRIEAALRELSARKVHGFVPALGEPVQYALNTTGKRLRPVLCLAAYRAARPGPPSHAVYTLSCAIEIVHTYSLVHDDLPCMDDDDLRRGRPTTHRVFGNVRATLAGAALLPIAMSTLDEGSAALGLSMAVRASLIQELATAAGPEGMVGGQLLDLEAERRDVGPEELQRIHSMKTGALLTSSLRIGAIAGEADSDLLAALTSYGRALGLAFQIADDVLDVSGRSEDLGKESGRDAELRKASYPSLFGIEGARDLAHRAMVEACDSIGDYDLPDLVALAQYVVERRK